MSIRLRLTIYWALILGAILTISAYAALRLFAHEQWRSMDAALLEHEGGHIKDGGGVKDTKGGYIYEVEVTDRKGEEWDMAIDATTGVRSP